MSEQVPEFHWSPKENIVYVNHLESVWFHEGTPSADSVRLAPVGSCGCEDAEKTYSYLAERYVAAAAQLDEIRTEADKSAKLGDHDAADHMDRIRAILGAPEVSE